LAGADIESKAQKSLNRRLNL